MNQQAATIYPDLTILKKNKCYSKITFIKKKESRIKIMSTPDSPSGVFKRLQTNDKRIQTNLKRFQTNSNGEKWKVRLTH